MDSKHLKPSGKQFGSNCPSTWRYMHLHSGIPFRGKYFRETFAYGCQEISTQMFIGVLFVLWKTKNYPNVSPKEKWANKPLKFYTMYYNTAAHMRGSQT